MNGIIGEVNTCFDYSEEMSREGEAIYTASICGNAIDEMDYFLEKDVPFSLLTKVGKDMQGEMHLDFLTNEYGVDEDDILLSPYPSSLIVDGTLMVRGTSPSTIKREEVVSFIEDNDISSLLISSLFLSFDPVRKEIIGALESKRGKIERVVIDVQDPTRILMLEDIYDSIERIKKTVNDCFLLGEAVEIEGVKRVSKDSLKELFL